ncbi:ParA family protein [Aeromonas veronii]|uniref:AAA family ATPase n=1 Tax=Aeromonas veronii TaxID=654 RepID=A0AAW5MDA2_AERVE|nr:AAA family ATPase [Aeromonas veronii]MCR4451179.1 AAA family ATPase [Aeromonas veronii]
MKIVSIFNNKGGVGKTTYMFHVAHLIAEHGKTVLMVDADAQCNLSAYCLTDTELEKAWNVSRGNSIWRAIEDVYKGIGDIRKRQPTKITSEKGNLYLIPGDVLLSNYEDSLGDTWSSAKGGSEPALRVQSAIYRYILWCAEKVNADVVMLDLGPNLGALNRSLLGASDYFIVPMSPDLFSIRGTENLGNKLVVWNKEWQQCHDAWSGGELELPPGKPTFLGYVMQQHNTRQSATGMTQGWSIFGGRVENAVKVNVVDKLEPNGQAIEWDDGNWNLGKIPNLHSLIPYSQEARKPVFYCTSKDGLKGAHISTALKSKNLFKPIVDALLGVV